LAGSNTRPSGDEPRRILVEIKVVVALFEEEKFESRAMAEHVEVEDETAVWVEDDKCEEPSVVVLDATDTTTVASEEL
jgi:hypothetical protein